MFGEVPEWLNGLAWNASMPEMVSGVRISSSPQSACAKAIAFAQLPLRERRRFEKLAVYRADRREHDRRAGVAELSIL